MMFTVETVACLGACGLAPGVVIDEQVYGQVMPERALGLVDDIKAAEMLMARAGATTAAEPALEESHE
jgi:NADH-quinone oxidoreductase subunit E